MFRFEDFRFAILDSHAKEDSYIWAGYFSLLPLKLGQHGKQIILDDSSA